MSMQLSAEPSTSGVSLRAKEWGEEQWREISRTVGRLLEHTRNRVESLFYRETLGFPPVHTLTDTESCEGLDSPDSHLPG